MAEECFTLLDFPVFSDRRGKLSAIESDSFLPYHFKDFHLLQTSDIIQNEHILSAPFIILSLHKTIHICIDNGCGPHHVILHPLDQGLLINHMGKIIVDDSSISSSIIAITLTSQWESKHLFYNIVSDVPIEFPFAPKRVFFINNIPVSEIRGDHAHKESEQYVLALDGTFQIRTNDGEKDMVFNVSKACPGIDIKPLVWASLFDFSRDAICMGLSDKKFDVKDYIMDFGIIKKRQIR